MMTDPEFEILPLGFEAEYASEIRTVQPRRIPTWTRDKYPPGKPCDLCLRRFKRAWDINVEWSKLIQKLCDRNDEIKIKCDAAWERVNYCKQQRRQSVSDYQVAMDIEQALTNKRIALLQQINNARLREFLSAKRCKVAYWKAHECICKRQRSFLYAHNSIRE